MVAVRKGLKILCDFRPVHHVPKRLQIIRALVLIFQVIRVFPNIHAEDDFAFHAGDGFAHERVVLVRRRDYLQFAAVRDEPRPAAAETSDARRLELRLKIRERPERAVDRVAELARRRAAGLGRENFPEERMVPMTAAVVAHRAADGIRHGGQIADERFERFAFQRGVASDGLVEIGDVSPVMLVVMDLHRQRVKMGLERGFVVGQGW
jgi:hypothetical protein